MIQEYILGIQKEITHALMSTNPVEWKLLYVGCV